MAVDVYRADMLEIDVHATSDGVLVVSHDATVDRCTEGKGRIVRRAAADLARLDAGYRFTTDGGRTFPFRNKGIHIPTLAEVLDAFPDTRLNIDVKPKVPSLADLLARTLREKAAVERCFVGSIHDVVANRLLTALPEACHFFPKRALTSLLIAVWQGRALPVHLPFHVLDVPYRWAGRRLVGPKLVARARERSLWLNTWTVDDVTHMRELVALGVGGIMTDRPDLLQDVLRGVAG